MKRISILKRLLVFLIGTFSFSRDGVAQNLPIGIDKKIDSFFEPISDFIMSIVFFPIQISDDVSVPLIVIWLVLGGAITSFYLGFPSIRYFKHGYNIVRGKYVLRKEKGQVSHFQALTVAISGTVGLGNIAGVAVAISIGGPGAVLWMTLAGFLGMSTKSAECTLGVKYRKINPDGSVLGGAMYYIQKAFDSLNLSVLGKITSFAFAFACLFGGVGAGGMFQANQAFEQFLVVTGGEQSPLVGYGWVFGVIIGVFISSVVIGGIKSIVNITDKVIPLMIVSYVSLCFLFIVLNIYHVPAALYTIFTEAFSPTAVAGGAIGAIIQGFRRSAFSNEAGIGSAPIAHSTVNTNRPVTEGFVSILEPFIDTVVVCNLTALVIVLSGVPLDGQTVGVQLTSTAFATMFSWIPSVLFFIVLMFSVSTALTWAFYCAQSWTFLTNRSPVGFIIFYSLMIVVGASTSLENLIGFSDGAFFLMSIPNLIAVYILLSEVKKDMKDFDIDVKTGKILLKIKK